VIDRFCFVQKLVRILQQTFRFFEWFALPNLYAKTAKH